MTYEELRHIIIVTRMNLDFALGNFRSKECYEEAKEVLAVLHSLDEIADKLIKESLEEDEKEPNDS